MLEKTLDDQHHFWKVREDEPKRLFRRDKSGLSSPQATLHVGCYQNPWRQVIVAFSGVMKITYYEYILTNRCNAIEECKFMIDNSMFPDPCRNILKIAYIQYACGENVTFKI